MKAKLSFRLVTCLLCSCLNPGCSINAFGIPGTVFEETSESDTAVVKEVRAYGVHVYTWQGFGIQIGHIKRKLVFPKASSAPSDCYQIAIEGSGALNQQGKSSSAEDAAPFFVDREQRGASLSLDRTSLSISLGVTRRQTVRIPVDSDAVFFIDSRQPDSVCALIDTGRLESK